MQIVPVSSNGSISSEKTKDGGGSSRVDRESVEGDSLKIKNKASNSGRKIKIKIRHAGLKRLLSGAFAGAVSRTAVAPLETVRTHLMVGSAGKTLPEVFNNIMENEGWKGLFRGNFVNVLRVAPAKAIEV